MNKNFKRLAFIPLIAALTFSTSTFAGAPSKDIISPKKINPACAVVMPIINSLPLSKIVKTKIEFLLCTPK